MAGSSNTKDKTSHTYEQQQSDKNDSTLVDILTALNKITKSIESVKLRLDRLESSQPKTNNKI
ncbi:Hypothetical protein CINCED_3A010443 [Cinara cedri]|uniref:Uncharacterized protein n=1 Tax=Cinara cedri TaxID=506608 RepID=A0A5E4M508_9HEMI|nr:Hypothetical protein CINCED_3A010443 [Cinara cedri]